MKMPRSQSETENVQFVQELAEVDGPFEAPININFRDLTKLELPSLVWNRGDTCPKKMKITNTGHTVIVSGKWKCERPYLTGGPLLGKYVFSQIHFHWGQDDCKGSEHQICGEGFPLEMHVAHFKTEYMTQECALREKDGMVVVVYLFKLQEEPNHSLKKIINSLPLVKQPSTSHPIDPRPILSLCNPFTDDYFMYWGSVVTSTCAHILLWIICREPFGISREQVSEFRKIMDSSQQPIFRNSRDIQPLHKRNVFHVNASKHLDDPLLPVKKILGCYCKKSDETINIRHSNECNCQGVLQNQEDVEESFADCTAGNQCLDIEGVQALHVKAGLSNNCFANQTFVVQTATVKSVSIVVKRSESESFKNYCGLDNLKKIKSQGDTEGNSKQMKLVSQSCCFLPNKEVTQMKIISEKSKKPFDSVKAFSQIMRSLETLKNHTFKKLKEIESINQEIKEMKPLCQDTEDKKWIRKIEKIMTKQKRFTIKSSQGCLSELRKLAKECNFDKYFDSKALPENDHTGEKNLVWLPNDETPNGDSPNYDVNTKDEENPETEDLAFKNTDVSKAVQFSEEAQKLIRSFFEDIKESEDIQETVKKNISLKKIKSFHSKQEDINSVPSETKGYITQKMFILGNLGGRFFTEVSAEEFRINEDLEENKNEELIAKEISQTNDDPADCEIENTVKAEKPGAENNNSVNSTPNMEPLIPLHRTNVTILSSKNTIEETPAETAVLKDASFSNEEKLIDNLEISSDAESVLIEKTKQKPSSKKKSEKINLRKSTSAKEKELYELTSDKLVKALEATIMLPKYRHSSSNLSTESTETQRMIIAKIRQSRKDFWEKNKHKSEIFKISSKILQSRASCKKFEGYYIQKKNLKNKKRKNQKVENVKPKSLYGLSSTSKEENTKTTKSKWKRVAKAKFKLEIEKTSGSTTESIIENCLISPERKKLKLEGKKFKTLSTKGSESKLHSKEHNNLYLTDTETRTIITDQLYRSQEYESVHAKKENFEKEQTNELKALEYKSVDNKQKIIIESSGNDFRAVSQTSIMKTFRASSADSKKSYSDTKEIQQLPKETVKKEIPSFTRTKPVHKIKSLSNLETTTRAITEFSQRTYLESIENRRKSNKDTAVRHNIENLRKLEDKHIIIALSDVTRGTSNETIKKIEEQHNDEINRVRENKTSCDLETQKENEFEVGFFTTNPTQVDNDIAPKGTVQEGQAKNPTLRRCDTEKYQFLENGSHEFNPFFQENHGEYSDILHRTDSHKSCAKENIKGDVAGNTELQSTVFCSTITSRAHSAETLHSHKKTFNRKSKKRPHCCKRSSRHYIRKNSSVFRKPNKLETKPLHFLNLTDEEQLKIISVNVAKYLQQKLVEENKALESGKKSTEEKQTNIKPLQEKKEPPPQSPSSVKKVETKPEKLPIEKEPPKKEEQKRRFGTLRKPKPIKLHFETKKTPPVDISSKPANNFIKLNKQMAGKYKRLKQDGNKPESNLPEKEKEKPEPIQKTIPEVKTKTEIPKAKPKILKNKKEPSPVSKSEKVKEKAQSRPETPSSPKFPPKKNSQEEKQKKSLKTMKKQKSNPKKTATETTKETLPSAVDEKSNQSMNNEPNTEKSSLPSPAPQEKSEEGTCSTPVNSPTSRLPTPIAPAENQTKQKNKFTENAVDNKNPDDSQSEVLCDVKSKIQEEKKSEVLFKKELEYFIKLQMCLNNEISTNIENSLTYVKAKPGETNETDIKENSPENNSATKKIVLMEKKDLLEISSSGSEFAVDLAKCTLDRDENVNKNGNSFNEKEIFTVKTPEVLNDIEGSNSALVLKGGQEECNSDSSYDCKISITLNTNPNTKEPENEIQSYDLYNYLGENSNNSQTTMCLEGSSSQSTVMKSHRKRRKENEIPVEMKQKLLEILEGEIKREVGITSGGSSENSSDVLTFKCEDSDGNNRSQSTESSCDNIEVLAQISNTMRQYLTYLKEMKQLSDKDGKEYDEL